MADDDIELPVPDINTLGRPGRDGFSDIIVGFTTETVRRLIAERVAAAVAAERGRRAQPEAGKTTEARRLADMIECSRGPECDCARNRAAAMLREQAAELERLRAPHDECPLWPPEDGR